MDSIIMGPRTVVETAKNQPVRDSNAKEALSEDSEAFADAVADLDNGADGAEGRASVPDEQPKLLGSHAPKTAADGVAAFQLGDVRGTEGSVPDGEPLSSRDGTPIKTGLETGSFAGSGTDQSKAKKPDASAMAMPEAVSQSPKANEGGIDLASVQTKLQEPGNPAKAVATIASDPASQNGLIKPGNAGDPVSVPAAPSQKPGLPATPSTALNAGHSHAEPHRDATGTSGTTSEFHNKPATFGPDRLIPGLPARTEGSAPQIASSAPPPAQANVAASDPEKVPLDTRGRTDAIGIPVEARQNAPALQTELAGQRQTGNDTTAKELGPREAAQSTPARSDDLKGNTQPSSDPGRMAAEAFTASTGPKAGQMAPVQVSQVAFAGRDPVPWQPLVEAGQFAQESAPVTIDRSTALDRPSSILPTAEPRPIARQVAEASVQIRDGTIELQLSPDELGRVRLTMNAGEAGLQVQIGADRPETLELLRRNIALLGEEFAEMGLGTAAFSFGEAGQDGGQGSSTPVDGQLFPDQGEATEVALSAAPTPASTNTDSARLDIRL